MMAEYRESYRGKRVLVTGGAGAIGSTLVKNLCEAGAELVIVLDDLSSGYRWNLPSAKNMMFVQGNILDEVKLKRIFFETPQVIFHLAAFFANQNSVDYPEADLMTNGMGTLRILEYAQLANVERVIYASSGSIYGGSAPIPLKEESMTMNLKTPYQVTKMLGELYCNFFYHHYGLPVVKTRFFNSYGPGEVPGQYRNVVPNFIFWAMQGKPLPITGSGDETRNFTFVEDTVDGLLRAGYAQKAIGQEINLSSTEETRILDLATLVNELTGNKAGIAFTARRKWDTKNRRPASVERARELLGFEARTPFVQGIPKTIAWFRDVWDNIIASSSFEPGMSSAVRETDEKKNSAS